jgi:carbonic anhydrase/acetyltransferase-like protein (isoleucine patch superfamily)
MTTYCIGAAQPLIADSAYIAPGAHVIGQARLNEHSSVWFGAVIRADNDIISVGERSNIQEGAVLHVDPGTPLTIGSDVTVGHQAMLHGCTVGDGSLVGIQAVILNRVVIGKGCLIGAGSLIPEGKVIPDFSLVIGSPGKVVRTLEPAEVEQLKAGAANYVLRAANFKSNLQVVASQSLAQIAQDYKGQA